MKSELLAFVDTETTGLDPFRHEIWEVGLIVDETEHRWFLPVDLGRADPMALKVGQWHERVFLRHDGLRTLRPEHEGEKFLRESPLSEFSQEFAALTRGRHLVGAVISFDEERLRRVLQDNGACPEWHYHLIDVEALAVGYLSRAAEDLDPANAQQFERAVTPPWDSSELSRLVGVEPGKFDKHTALGDARWAKAIFEAVTE